MVRSDSLFALVPVFNETGLCLLLKSDSGYNHFRVSEWLEPQLYEVT